MPSVVENINLISKTMESILDFVANDEALSQDFSKYLEINNIEIESEKEFNNIIIQYMLDMKMQNGLRVLEYYRRNNDVKDEIVEALLNSFCGVFRVKKILSNGYIAKCLTSDAELTLIPLVKMMHLKQIGRYDYIQARILELNDTQYILEIYDVISEFDLYKATTNAIKYMIECPKSAYYKNPEKKEMLEKSVQEFYVKFTELFNCDFISTTNKQIDKLIELFNNYRLENVKKDYENLIEKPPSNRFFNIKEFNCSDDTFLQNAIGGFSSHKEIYDVALWMDKNRGLYIIPFLDTFLKSFKEELEGSSDCIKEFLTSDKIPPSVLKYAYENNKNFFDVINSVLKTRLTNFEEVLFNTKSAYITSGIYSPITVLFNSDLFDTLLGIENQEQKV